MGVAWQIAQDAAAMVRARLLYRWHRHRFDHRFEPWFALLAREQAAGRRRTAKAMLRHLIAHSIHGRRLSITFIGAMKSQGEIGQALDIIDALPETLRAEPGLMRETAAVLYEAGEFEEARAVAMDAHSRAPADEGALGVLLISLCALGQPVRALRTLKQAEGAALNCNWAIDVVFRKLSEKIDQNALTDAEYEYIKDNSALVADNAVGHLLQAKLHRKLGDADAAAAHFLEALDADDALENSRREICENALDSANWAAFIDVMRDVYAALDPSDALAEHLEERIHLHGTLTRFFETMPDVDPDYQVPASALEMAYLSPAKEPYQPGKVDVALLGATLGGGGAENVLCNAYLGLKAEHELEAEMWIYSIDALMGHDFFFKERGLDMVPAGDVRLCPRDRNPRRPFSWLMHDTAQCASAVYSQLEATRPQVIHAWQDSTNLEAAYAAVHAGVPKIVLHPHNMRPDLVHTTEIAKSFRRAYRAVLTRSDVELVCVSEASLQDYLRWLQVERNDRHHVVPNGFFWPDRPPADALDEKRASLRRSFGIASDRFVVGGLFRVVAIKRPMLWLEVACQMVRRDKHIVFLLFGDGDELVAMRDVVDRLGLSDRILFAGQVHNAAEKCAVFDLLLHTSASEGLPTVFLEAQAHGVPVLCTDVGGASEALHQDFGVALKDPNVAQFCEQIKRFQKYPLSTAERDTLAAFVRARFGVAQMIDRLRQIYGL